MTLENIQILEHLFQKLLSLLFESQYLLINFMSFKLAAENAAEKFKIKKNYGHSQLIKCVGTCIYDYCTHW